MKRRTATGIVTLAGVMLSFAVAVAQFSDPFSVSASLGKSAKELVISVEFVSPAEHYLYADQIKITTTDGVGLREKTIPEPKQKFDPTFDKVLGTYEGKSVFVYSMDLDTALPLSIKVEYQGCSGTLCYPPQEREFKVGLEKTVSADPEKDKPGIGEREAAEVGSWQERIERFAVQGLAVGYLNVPDFLAVLDRAESGGGEGQDSLFDFFIGKGILLMVVGVVLVGLGLNMTPCVLPMIPVNLAIIGAGVQDDVKGAERAALRLRGFALGLTYGAGIAFSYGLLGLLVVLTGSRLGTLNASPVFNIGIAIVFLLLSLAMFGVFNIDLTRLQSGKGGGQSGRGRFGAAFVLGAIAALLAGACVAPAVIAVLVQSTVLYNRGVRIGLLLPFLLGSGMALPWPFAGAGLSFLPKAGAWMERIKHVFGVMILVAAIYYGHLGYSLLASPSAGDADSDADGWYGSLDNALQIAEEENKPVFVDIWASWCKACLKMDETTFKDPEVKRRLDQYVKVRFIAEKQKDPSVKPLLDRFVKVGLPTYVVLAPGKDQG